MKTYLIDEEVLRQVLEVIDNVIADWDDMTITPDELKAVTTLRAILASPPAEPEYDTPEWWAKVREHDKRKDT